MPAATAPTTIRRVGLGLLGGAAAVALLASPALAATQTITFEEFPPTNANSPQISNEYTAQGVIFTTDDATTWDGLTNGDPGNWGLDGTNGPTFLGWNGPSYAATLAFAPVIETFSMDCSRSNGSQAGDTLTVTAFAGATQVDTQTEVFGDIDVWTTFSLSGVGIDRIEVQGAAVGGGTSFHPFGCDNLVFGVPDATTSTTSTTLAPGTTVATTASTAAPTSTTAAAALVTPAFTG